MTTPQDHPTGVPPQGAAPQPYPGTPPAGYIPPGYAMPAPVAPRGPQGLSIASLVLGLSSILFGFTFLVPIVGLILGIVGLRREPAGRGMAIAGVILSALVLLVWAAIVAVLIATGLLATTIALTSHAA